MFQWRLRLREAQDAIAAGRYDEAHRLLSDENIREFLPAKRLADQLASRYADRAQQRVAWGQSSAGFADLAALDRLGGPQHRADAIRHDYAQRAESEASEKLRSGEPAEALTSLKRAHRRGVDSAGLRLLQTIAEAWHEGLGLADAGDMLRAETSLERARRAAQGAGEWGKMELTVPLENELSKLRQRSAQLAEVRERLRQAAIDKDWPQTLRAADDALRLAPRDRAVLSLRRRAWRELELDRTRPYPSDERNPSPDPMNGQPKPNENARRLARAIRRSTAVPSHSKQDTAIGAAPANRRMLWVDAVGGFLVCLDDEVVIGQPAGGATPGLPILADISRRHVVLRREQGAYVLEPISPTKMDGKEVTGPIVLGDSHTIQLAGSVSLQFHKPHALSSTARLSVISGHRTAPAADGVLLMAESCVMGAGKHSHVRCRDLENDLILFRQGDRLLCRSSAKLLHDGRVEESPCELSDGSRIEGQDFAFCVEVV